MFSSVFQFCYFYLCLCFVLSGFLLGNMPKEMYSMISREHVSSGKVASCSSCTDLQLYTLLSTNCLSFILPIIGVQPTLMLSQQSYVI